MQTMIRNKAMNDVKDHKFDISDYICAAGQCIIDTGKLEKVL